MHAYTRPHLHACVESSHSYAASSSVAAPAAHAAATASVWRAEAAALVIAAGAGATACAGSTSTGSGAPGLQAAWHDASLSKLLALPPQPPKMNSSQRPAAGFQNQRGMLPRHSPVSAGMLQAAGLAEAPGNVACWRSLRSGAWCSLQGPRERVCVYVCYICCVCVCVCVFARARTRAHAQRWSMGIGRPGAADEWREPWCSTRVRPRRFHRALTGRLSQQPGVLGPYDLGMIQRHSLVRRGACARHERGHQAQR